MEQAEKLLRLLLDVSQPNLLLFRRLLRLVFRFDRLQSFVENCPRFFGFTSSFSIADISLSKVFENLETVFEAGNFLGSAMLGPLENHVLDEMGDTIPRQVFVARTSFQPNEPDSLGMKKSFQVF